jgi:UDP-4-amino-4,6-dideoxy-N-acetyl-beta-L-altrosamine N-acetyltransferase
MFNTGEIPWDEHVVWFERTLLDPRKHALVFERNEQAAGFACIHEYSSGMIAEWGFYKAPVAPGGTGKLLAEATLHHAFEVLNLHKIYAQVLHFNKRSIDLHQALGFTLEGVLKDQHFDGHAYYDVFCFGIRRGEWAASALQTGLNL